MTEITPAVRTDHDAISLELGKFENELKGPGNWKMNCSLLDDEEYEEDIARMIPLCTAEGQKEFTDDRMIWDWIKYNVRARAIQYSKRKAKERGKKELGLLEELSKAKSKLENNPNDHNITFYNVVQGRLESFYEEKTKGAIIRARAKCHEHGEKSTKYFLNLGKRNHVKNHIRKLCINGKITTNPHCILKEQERFYRELYKSSINSPNIGEKISCIFERSEYSPTFGGAKKFRVKD